MNPKNLKDKMVMVGPPLRFSPDTCFEFEGEIKIKYWNKKHGEQTIILKPEYFCIGKNGPSLDRIVKSRKIQNVE